MYDSLGFEEADDYGVVGCGLWVVGRGSEVMLLGVRSGNCVHRVDKTAMPGNKYEFTNTFGLWHLRFWYGIKVSYLR